MPDQVKSNSPSDDDIRRRAYEIYLQRGGEHGYDESDWLAAERELAAGEAEIGNTRGVAAAAGAGIPQGAQSAGADGNLSNGNTHANAAAAGAGANSGKPQRTAPRQ